MVIPLGWYDLLENLKKYPTRSLLPRWWAYDNLRQEGTTQLKPLDDDTKLDLRLHCKHLQARLSSALENIRGNATHNLVCFIDEAVLSLGLLEYHLHVHNRTNQTERYPLAPLVYLNEMLDPLGVGRYWENAGSLAEWKLGMLETSQEQMERAMMAFRDERAKLVHVLHDMWELAEMARYISRAGGWGYWDEQRATRQPLKSSLYGLAAASRNILKLASALESWSSEYADHVDETY